MVPVAADVAGGDVADLVANDEVQCFGPLAQAGVEVADLEDVGVDADDPVRLCFNTNAARNRHRASSRGAWSKVVVRAILHDPRYTGYEAWNRQRRHEELVDLEDVVLGRRSKMR